MYIANTWLITQLHVCSSVVHQSLGGVGCGRERGLFRLNLKQLHCLRLPTTSCGCVQGPWRELSPSPYRAGAQDIAFFLIAYYIFPLKKVLKTSPCRGLARMQLLLITISLFDIFKSCALSNNITRAVYGMASGNGSLKLFRVSIGLANYEVFTMQDHMGYCLTNCLQHWLGFLYKYYDEFCKLAYFQIGIQITPVQ